MFIPYPAEKKTSSDDIEEEHTGRHSMERRSGEPEEESQSVRSEMASGTCHELGGQTGSIQPSNDQEDCDRTEEDQGRTGGGTETDEGSRVSAMVRRITEPGRTYRKRDIPELLCHLFVRKKNGTEFIPNTLHHLCSGKMHHLRHTSKPNIDLFGDSEFVTFEQLLIQR